jgi:hypothetical protein
VKPEIVIAAENITPEWLTQVLAVSGVGGTVTRISASGVGTGQMGENVRFELEGENVPSSLIGKFPSTDATSRQTGADQLSYLREVFFYNTIRDTVDIQTPKVLFADAEPTTHDFVIIMEDLAPGTQGDQVAGCSVDQAALALEQLARLQGPRWGDPALLAHPLLTSGSAEENAAGAQLIYQAVQPGFVERYANRLTDEDVQLCHEVGDALGSYHESYAGPPGLVHVDYRLDNMIFDGPYPLTIVDWQTVTTGCPVADASYFLGTSLLPELRQAEERHLLRHYLEVLHSYKVDFDWESCFACYRNYAPAGLLMAVIASMIVGETERGNDMFMAMATRSAQMCRDLETLSIQ